jgi:farnesyl diphosphate synthase/geranylgeranyl diphosphate synthase type II
MQAPSFLAEHAASVEQYCQQILAHKRPHVPARLLDAMLYSLLAGGKRVRLLCCCHAIKLAVVGI